MPRKHAPVRILLATAVAFSFTALGALVSCSDDTNGSGPDAGCTGAACVDATVDVGTADAAGYDQSSPQDAATNDQSSPGDGGATDADVHDADPYADADPNCGHYVAAAGGSPASVRIVNQRDAGIYIGQPVPSCEPFVGFTFADQTDASYPIAGNCQDLCSTLQSSCCSPECQTPIVTKIDPGKSYDIGWPGTVFTPKWMPPSCYADAGCATGTCLQEIAAPNGNVSLVVYAGATCDGGPCPYDCSGGVSGSCIVQYANGVNGTATTVHAPYTSGQGTVTLNVQ